MNITAEHKITREDGQVMLVTGGIQDGRGDERFLEFRLPDQDVTARVAWTSEATESRPSPIQLRLQVNGGELRPVISRNDLLYDATPANPDEQRPLEVPELVAVGEFLKQVDVKDVDFGSMFSPITPFSNVQYAGCVAGSAVIGGRVGAWGGLKGALAGGLIGAATGAVACAMK